jgi:uncharacterized protein with PIN domain
MVIVVGKDKKAVYEITCHNCASILEYTMSETIERKCNQDYLGDFDIRRFINCPACGQAVMVKQL